MYTCLMRKSTMPAPSMRRVVITGLGVLAPNGIGKHAFWEACIAGRSGIRPITQFDASALPTRIAGEIPDFDPAACALTPEEQVHLDRNTQFSIAAAHLALQDAHLAEALSEAERNRMGVYMGSAMASNEESDTGLRHFLEQGAQVFGDMHTNLLTRTVLLTHSPAAAIAIHHHLHGPCLVFATGCSAGADAIGQAFWAIQEGQTDRMLAGGSDAAICFGGMNAFCVIGAMSTRNEDPQRASRPYDGGRDGFVMAEGAGVLLLEERDLALARGAHLYAELIAFVSNTNAYHMTSLPKDGLPLQQ